MKKITLLIFLFFLSLHLYSQREADDSWKNHVTTTFQGMDKLRVPHAVLLDFAMEFTNVEAYNGNLTDSTTIDLNVYGNIYKTLFMGRVTTDTTYFPEIKTLANYWASERMEFNEIGQDQNTIVIGGLFYKYSKIDPMALSENKITVNNNRYYDKYTNGVWQNPYLTQETVAFTPAINVYNKQNFYVVLPQDLMLGNSLGTIQEIELNANDGQGYRELNYDQITNINYSYNGTYDWIFKITLNNNTVLYSKSKVKIDEPLKEKNKMQSMTAFENDIQIPGPGGSIFLPNGATLRIDYAPGHNGEIRKPFIVAEGFDTGAITKPEKEGGDNTLEDFLFGGNKLPNSGNLQDLLDGTTQEYDIIYIDWYNGTADLRDNSVVLENVLDWVNSNKEGPEQNVLLGQSMGGVIGRYTLARMEDENNSHDVRLFISHDAPLQGSNTPLSTQFLSRHMYNAYSAAPVLHGLGESLMPLAISLSSLVSDAINGLGANTTVDPYVSPDDILTLQDTPAAVQMNYEWVSIWENVTSTLHDNWQQEFEDMGYPSNSRNIAISNGNECGTNQGFTPGDLLVSMHDEANPDGWGDILHFLLGTPLIGIAANDFGLSIVGALPGASKYFFDFDLRSTPYLSSGNRNVYSGSISYEKKFLWLVPIKYTITERDKDAPSGYLPYDSYAGGYYDINDALDQFPSVLPPITIHTPQYGFIPVVSALDIKRNNGEPNSGDYLKSYSGGTVTESGLSSSFDNFIVDYDPGAVVNNEHISFQQRNGDWLAEELKATTIPVANCSFKCSDTEIEGPDSICSSDSYNLNIGNANISWSVSPSNVVSLNDLGNGEVIVTKLSGSSNGEVTLNAFINSADCGSKTINKQITIGAKKPEGFVGVLVDPYLGRIKATVENVDGATGYEWYLDGVKYTGTGMNNSYVTMPIQRNDCNTRNYMIGVRAITECGTSSQYYELHNNPCYNGSYTYNYSPNPASSEITIEHTSFDKSTQSFSALGQTDRSKGRIVIYDSNGAVVQSQEYHLNDQSFRVDVTKLKPGNYFMKIGTGREEETHQIVIRR